MERHEGSQTPYEVYCHNCHVTFAAGTPTCVHCGNRISRQRGGGPTALVEMPETEVDAAEPSIGRRLGGMSLWVLLALGAALSRMCTEG